MSIPKEGSRDIKKEGKIISVPDDWCYSPDTPVAYPIWAWQSDAGNLANTVRQTDDRSHVLGSVVDQCYGDEQGLAGVHSGTIGAECTPKTWSETIRFEDRNAVRHTDEWWMNKRNTWGRLQYPKDMNSYVTPPIRQVYALLDPKTAANPATASDAQGFAPPETTPSPAPDTAPAPAPPTPAPTPPAPTPPPPAPATDPAPAPAAPTPAPGPAPAPAAPTPAPAPGEPSELPSPSSPGNSPPAGETKLAPRMGRPSLAPVLGPIIGGVVDWALRTSENQQLDDCCIGPYIYNAPTYIGGGGGCQRCKRKGATSAHHAMVDYPFRTGGAFNSQKRVPGTPSYLNGNTICLPPGQGDDDHGQLHDDFKAGMDNIQQKNGGSGLATFAQVKYLSLRGINGLSSIPEQCKFILRQMMSGMGQYNVGDDLQLRGLEKPSPESDPNPATLNTLLKAWSF